MIPVVYWRRSRCRDGSPFEQGQSSPLRITLHVAEGATSIQERDPLGALRDFAGTEHLDVLSAQEGDSRLVVANNLSGDPSRPHRLVTVTRPNRDRRKTGVFVPQRWEDLANGLVHEGAASSVRSGVWLLAAHEAIRTDLFVTTDPALLALRERPEYRELNIRAPVEASRILGLLMRNREHYSHGRDRSLGSKAWFYWALVRGRLPEMWRYFSACVYSEKARGDDVTYLGQSVLNRAKYALEARDAIGIQFYRQQTNSTRDTIMYHLPYLALLLAGALDAQARVAKRAYGLQGVERTISFRDPGFRKQLLSAGASQLATLTDEGSRFDGITSLLWGLRNTIHGASYGDTALIEGAEPQKTFINIPKNDTGRIEAALAKLGVPARIFGFRRLTGLSFEPFSYAVRICDEGLGLMNSIARATDVSGLFPPGTAIPKMLDGPPHDDEAFAKATVRRLRVLA